MDNRKKKKKWLTGLKKGERRWRGLSATLVLKCQASGQCFNIGRQQEMFWKFSTSKLVGQTFKINYLVMTSLVKTTTTKILHHDLHSLYKVLSHISFSSIKVAMKNELYENAL